MATRTWQADGASTTSNWGDTANWSSATVPVNGDSVIIDAGSRSISAGLDLSGGGGIDLASIYVGPNFTGDIGTDVTNPLIVGCTGLVRIKSGGSKVHLKATAADIATVHCIGIGESGNGSLYLCGGTITSFVLNRGQVQVYAGTVTSAKLAAASVDTSGNFVAIGNSEARLDVLNGTVTTLIGSRGIASILPTSSTGVITTARLQSCDLSVYAGTLTNLENYGISRILWYTTTNMTSAILYGGLLDASGNAAARTITTLEAHTGSKYNVTIGASDVTVTNLIDYGGQEYFGFAPDLSGA